MHLLKYFSPPDVEVLLLRRLRSESVSVTHPLLIKRQWNSINHPGARFFGPGSSKSFYWTCTNGHKFFRPISSVTRAYDKSSKFGGCPECSGRRPAEIVSLAALPLYEAEWMENKN